MKYEINALSLQYYVTRTYTIPTSDLVLGPNALSSDNTLFQSTSVLLRITA